MAAVLACRDRTVDDLNDDNQVPGLEQRGIELFRGHARRDGEGRGAIEATMLPRQGSGT